MKKFTFIIIAIITISLIGCQNENENTYDEINTDNILNRPPPTLNNSVIFKGKAMGYVKYNELSNLYPTNNFSIETVFSISNISSENRYIYSNYNVEKGVILSVSNDRLYYTINSNTRVIYSGIEPNECYNLSVVNEEGTFSFYLNGDFIYSMENYFIPYFHGVLTIASNGFQSNTSNTPPIIIDEFRIWKIPISRDQINELQFTILSPNNHPYLLGYYNFNNEPNDMIYDTAGSNDGHLIRIDYEYIPEDCN